MSHSGMKCLELMKETVKILGAHFCYNKKLEHEINFQSHIVKIESVLRLWRMRNLMIEGKVLVFKSSNFQSSPSINYNSDSARNTQ